MRVRIAAGGREVEITAEDTDLATAAAKALALWLATAGATQPAVSAGFGLTAGDLATDRPPTSTIRHHPGVPDNAAQH